MLPGTMYVFSFFTFKKATPLPLPYLTFSQGVQGAEQHYAELKTTTTVAVNNNNNNNNNDNNH
jgi:hypothetical protein